MLAVAGLTTDRPKASLYLLLSQNILAPCAVHAFGSVPVLNPAWQGQRSVESSAGQGVLSTLPELGPVKDSCSNFHQDFNKSTKSARDTKSVTA